MPGFVAGRVESVAGALRALSGVGSQEQIPVNPALRAAFCPAAKVARCPAEVAECPEHSTYLGAPPWAGRFRAD